MSKPKERSIIRTAIDIFIILLVTVAVSQLAGCRSDEPENKETVTENAPEPSQSEPATENPTGSAQSNTPVAIAPEMAVPVKPDTTPAVAPKPDLNDVIKKARYWGPAYKQWDGKAAPDFTLTDINGKEHKLSDYRGKNVVLVFWATWCGPCLIEIPDLIKLRSRLSEENLAILAITDEKPDKVKKFVAAQKMNYTILLQKGGLPNPFGFINAIPCSFFIKPDGKIKLATTGVLSLDEILAVLKADWQ